MYVERAVILQRPRLPWERQVAVCLAYANRRPQPYRLLSVVWREEDAVSLVRMAACEVVVTALDGPDDDRLQAQIEAAGGRLEFCRPRRQRRATAVPVDTVDIIERMWHAGVTTEQMQMISGKPLTRIRQILDRLSRRKPPNE